MEHYRNRTDGFRDPKIKNKQVWEQIVEAMKIDGVSCFGAKECETKFKNLKRSYTRPVLIIIKFLVMTLRNVHFLKNCKNSLVMMMLLNL